MKNRNYAFIMVAVLLLAAAICSCTVSLAPKKDVKIDYQKQFETAYAQLSINDPPNRENKQPLVLAHYMPWFQKYGYHWQEGSSKYDSTQVLPNGRANISSHYYPLTGNYDSADPLILEYQLALMKMAGIDGTIIDWNGDIAGVDYKPIHDATIVLVEQINKRGMKYALCYEDQSIMHLIEFGIFPKDEGRSRAKGTFDWLAKNWFVDGSYVKVDGRPLLLCFGPQYFNQKADWDEVWSNVNPKPFFIDLDGRTNFADGAKCWSPMHLSSGGKLSITSLVKYLNEFYRKQEQKPFVVGTALPEFRDIYAQAGVRPSYGYLDYSDGETLKLTWTAAERARANVVQVQTWNDYGEGTIIEPTIEHGYESLEFIQDKRKEWEADFPFGYNDLRIPIELYKIVQDEKADAAKKQQVAGIYDLIFAGNAQGVRDAARDAGITYDFSVSPLLLAATTSDEKVVVFDPAGRKNLALGKPVVASSRIDVYSANRAVDGDVNGASYWEGAANAYPGTLQVDLVTPSAISTVVIKLNPQRMWSKRTQRFEVKVSNDGSTWTTVVPTADYVFDPGENANTVVIPCVATTRYVQLSFTANSGGTNGQVAEFEVYGD